MMSHNILSSLVLLFCIILLLIAAGVFLLKRSGIWHLIGSVVLLKGLVLTSFLFSQSKRVNSEEFFLMSVITLCLLPMTAFMGSIFLNRASPFRNLVSVTKEGKLKN